MPQVFRAIESAKAARVGATWLKAAAVAAGPDGGSADEADGYELPGVGPVGAIAWGGWEAAAGAIAEDTDNVAAAAGAAAGVVAEDTDNVAAAAGAAAPGGGAAVAGITGSRVSSTHWGSGLVIRTGAGT